MDAGACPTSFLIGKRSGTFRPTSSAYANCLSRMRPLNFTCTTPAHIMICRSTNPSRLRKIDGRGRRLIHVRRGDRLGPLRDGADHAWRERQIERLYAANDGTAAPDPKPTLREGARTGSASRLGVALVPITTAISSQCTL